MAVRAEQEPSPRVGPEDLRYIDQFLELLLALNDAYASATKIGALVAKIPPLAIRVIRQARRKAVRRDIHTVEQALALIGNRGLEAELLPLLEELTTLKAELEG